MQRFTASFLLLSAMVCPALAGQRIFSYINEKGVRVYTNTPSRSEETGTAAQEELKTAPALSTTTRGADLFGPLIYDSATRYDVDPSLVEAIMAVESGFDPFAVSEKNCKGLMQLHPDTAKRFGVDDVFDPEQNIEGGVKYLRYLQNLFDGDLEKVVAAYNAGEHAVERHDGTPPYRETQNYLRKVAVRYDLTQPGQRARAAEARTQKVHRIILPDGRVLYTNTPVDTISK